MMHLVPRMLVGMLLVMVTNTLHAHPFHATYAEVDWNREKKVLEIALRVQPEDLERVLRAKTGRRIDIEKTKDVDKLIRHYLAEVFVVLPREDKAKSIRWIGKEVSTKETWLYFEIVRPQGIENVKLLNRIFLEILPDQVNTVRVRHGKQRTTIRFNRDHQVPVTVKPMKVKADSAAGIDE